uniref:Uncharacterized protein n=1 Tax=Rousettus aegyptiacus TaxID=9407 RepID=A0A7J8C2Y4_ROUAE|nr:hypothetical protein HJG63_009485 [Rousettus aegyptiacus]
MPARSLQGQQCADSRSGNCVPQKCTGHKVQELGFAPKTHEKGTSEPPSSPTLAWKSHGKSHEEEGGQVQGSTRLSKETTCLAHTSCPRRAHRCPPVLTVITSREPCVLPG